MPGPKPTPTAQLAARGSWRAKERAGEPLPARVEAPKPPTKLTKPAKDVWKALAPSLAACGILTAADLPAFNRYCRLYALWSALMAKVEEEPNRGAILTLAKVDDMVKSLECSFGLTPSDRPGLRVETPEPTGKARFFGTETR